MNTLDDAWQWYTDTREQLHLWQRIARRYWTSLPWEGPLGQDNYFRELTDMEVRAKTTSSLAHLDDQAIVVLFSVFEATVREHVLSEVRRESQTLSHRTLIKAAEEAIQRIELGSFAHVLDPFKDTQANLVEEVNQVRRYRNWVAHGKRGPRTVSITPEEAFRRLNRFLDVLGLSSPPP